MLSPLTLLKIFVFALFEDAFVYPGEIFVLDKEKVSAIMRLKVNIVNFHVKQINQKQTFWR